MSQMKLVKPLMAQSIIPKEVDKLSDETKRITADMNMSSVQIVGDNTRKPGETEVYLILIFQRPSLYEPVITRRPTSIVSSLPVPEAISMHSQTLNSFAGAHNIQPQSAQPVRVGNGAYSIPVQVSKEAKVNDPTLANYETPSFIHKSEKQIDTNPPYDINSIASNPASAIAIHQLPSLNSSSDLQASVRNDIFAFTHELANAGKNTDQKLNISKLIF